jgi:hypothetical protein
MDETDVNKNATLIKNSLFNKIVLTIFSEPTLTEIKYGITGLVRWRGLVFLFMYIVWILQFLMIQSLTTIPSKGLIKTIYSRYIVLMICGIAIISINIIWCNRRYLRELIIDLDEKTVEDLVLCEESEKQQINIRNITSLLTIEKYFNYFGNTIFYVLFSSLTVFQLIHCYDILISNLGQIQNFCLSLLIILWFVSQILIIGLFAIQYYISIKYLWFFEIKLKELDNYIRYLVYLKITPKIEQLNSIRIYFAHIVKCIEHFQHIFTPFMGLILPTFIVTLFLLMIDELTVQKWVPPDFHLEINIIHLIEASIFSLLLLHIIRLTAALNFKLQKPFKYFIELGIIPMKESNNYAMAYHVS